MERNITSLLVTLEAVGTLLHQAYLGIVEGDMERVEEALTGMDRVAVDALRAEGNNVIKLLGRGKR